MDQIALILTKNNLRVTKPRLEILRLLLELNTHFTAEALRSELSARQISMTSASIYNTLNLFERCGIISRVSAAGEPVIYDINTYEHVHLCDTSTRTVMDYDDGELLQLVRDYLTSHPIDGVQINRINITLLTNTASL